MTKEQLEKLDAMAKPRSEEAITKAEERKKRWLNVQTMTQEELIKAWVAYRGEANVNSDQLQAIKWVLEKIDCGQLNRRGGA